MKKGVVPRSGIMIQMQDGGDTAIQKDGYLDINYILHHTTATTAGKEIIVPSNC